MYHLCNVSHMCIHLLKTVAVTVVGEAIGLLVRGRSSVARTFRHILVRARTPSNGILDKLGNISVRHMHVLPRACTHDG